jgi:hypothetical protein
MLAKLKSHGINSVIFAIFILAQSCVTKTAGTTESEWSNLDRAGAISCSAWPLKDNELDIASMTATASGGGGFVATVRMRNGSELPVLAETKGSDQIDADQLRSFPIGRGAYVVAMADHGNEPVAFVVQNKNERAWLEIRAIRDNRLVSRMAAPLPEEVTSGRIAPAKKGWWLQLNHSETSASFVAITPDKGSNWNFVISQFQAQTKQSQLVSSTAGSDALVLELPKGVDNDKSTFVLTRLDPSGKSSEAGKVQLATKGGIESWTAALVGTKIVFAVVRGDSMIGQSSLIVSAVGSQNIAQSWKNEFPMTDVHLGEPVLLANNSKGIIGLMRWIDGESSLLRVKVDGNGAEQLTEVGVFAKGSVLAAGYLNNKDRGLSAFRYRDKELWKYKICRVSL